MKNTIYLLLIVLFIPLTIIAQQVHEPGNGITSAGLNAGNGSYGSTIFGESAGTTGSGYSNIIIGNNAGRLNYGSSGVLIGQSAGYNNRGSYNTFVGHEAGYNTTTGHSNTMFGYRTGYYNTTGSSNMFFGYASGYKNTTGNYNIMSGNYTGYDNTSGTGNVFMGYYSGRKNTTGHYNTMLGYNSGYNNTSGQRNVFLGIQSGYKNATGNYNLMLGDRAGYNNVTGARNVFIGYLAGYNETGSDKLYIDNSTTSKPLIYGDFSTNTLTFNDNVIIGDQQTTSSLYPFQIYSANTTENIAMVLGNGSGRWEFATAGANGSFATNAKPGTGVIRRLGNHNMIFNMPNSNMTNPAYDTTNYNSSGVTSITFSDSVNHHSLKVYNTGKVTMGTEKYDNDNNYRLYVKDGIKTENIKVEIASANGWADYVFNEDYNLMPLTTVEQFIQKNKHLPEVPTAEEVVENGVELKSMNVLLLKKVEELTLYTIAQEKALEDERKRNNNLEQRLERLENLIAKQKK